MQTIPELKLRATTARDVMMPVVLSVSKTTTIREAAEFLFDQAISAAAVIDERGHPVGVISRSDFVRAIARQPESHPIPHYYNRLTLKPLPDELARLDFSGPATERTVADIMMSVVISVPQDAPVSRAIELMLEESIHRVFVTDAHGKLCGVISAFDILSRLME